MHVDSIKIKGYSCFTGDHVGFDEFKPISVIIGRNNTGKSRMLELVNWLTCKQLTRLGFDTICTATLDEEFLEKVFSKNRAGGQLGPYYGEVFRNENSHWNMTGKHFQGENISWSISANGQVENVVIPKPARLNAQYYEASVKAIREQLGSIDSPLMHREFRHLNADRDINPEPEADELKLDPNGAGATNLVRRYILSRTFDEDLIQVHLLRSLNKIFGVDGEFTRIEIRHHDDHDQSRYWEIYLGEKSKGLIPLSKSGSGLKTVLLTLLNLMVIPKLCDGSSNSRFVFAFEELENNLHPALLRRLLEFLAVYVENEKSFLFLTTHSNVALDFFGSRSDTRILHLQHNGEFAHAKTINTHFEQTGLLTELGCRPSDLLQANGVVWLEGPSDRIYINRFIELFSNGALREGKDYQCAYYGGAILAKTQFCAPDVQNEEFANLLRLNNNIAVICDGDRAAPSGVGSRLKHRVARIKSEVEAIPGAYFWITQAKEIENYIPGSVWSSVYDVPDVPDPTEYDSFSSKISDDNTFLSRHLNRKSFDKCAFATAAVQYLTLEAISTRFDLSSRLQELVKTVRIWSS